MNTNEYASLNYIVRLNEERINRKATNDTIDEDSDEALFISSTNSSDVDTDDSDEDEAVKKALEEAAKTPEQRKQEREEQKQKSRDKDVVLNESYNILIDIIDSGLPTGELTEKKSSDLDFILDFFSN
jgi:hydroxymethylpyrimidine pyrophosphatase-like HAD family hydrolase